MKKDDIIIKDRIVCSCGKSNSIKRRKCSKCKTPLNLEKEVEKETPLILEKEEVSEKEIKEVVLSFADSEIESKLSKILIEAFEKEIKKQMEEENEK